jgi:exodeoxyribonuclease VII large subunit
MEKIWTVSELNRLVKEVFEQTFYPFCVRGEVSNLTIHRSGHVYFSLKDSRSQVRAVFFRGAAEARRIELRNGMALEIRGRLTVY